MIRKDMHPVRKSFRLFLLGCLGLSLCFLITVIGFRVAYNDKNLPLPMTTVMFEADVVQHKVWASVSDDVQDMRIAEKMLRLGFFSPIYTRAGLDMLAIKADEGYAPAVTRVAMLEDQGIQVRR